VSCRTLVALPCMLPQELFPSLSFSQVARVIISVFRDAFDGARPPVTHSFPRRCDDCCAGVAVIHTVNCKLLSNKVPWYVHVYSRLGK
jgi:hypothetical protein